MKLRINLSIKNNLFSIKFLFLSFNHYINTFWISSLFYNNENEEYFDYVVNNTYCLDLVGQAVKAYRSPLLEQIDWGDKDTFAKAFQINRTNTDHKISIPNNREHFDLLKMQVITEARQIIVPNLEFTIGNSRKRIISLPEDDSHSATVENLSKCNFASLAYEVTFGNDDEDIEIKNPKIAIYPYDEGIQIKLVENLDEEFIYSNKLAVTFTLIDTEQEENEESKLNKFEVIVILRSPLDPGDACLIRQAEAMANC